MDATEFFYQHAGWSYAPGKETPEQGRRQCAAELAAAEQWAQSENVTFDWVPDPDSEWPNAEGAIAYDPNGAVVASLWDIQGATYTWRAMNNRTGQEDVELRYALIGDAAAKLDQSVVIVDDGKTVAPHVAGIARDVRGKLSPYTNPPSPYPWEEIDPHTLLHPMPTGSIYASPSRCFHLYISPYERPAVIELHGR